MSSTSSIIQDQSRILAFLDTLFEADDWVSFRLLETWDEGAGKKSKVTEEHCHQLRHLRDREGLAVQIIHQQAEATRSNLFFSVCPRPERSGSPWRDAEGSYGYAAHVRTVRHVWADLDHTTVVDALERVRLAGLPPPTVVVASGNGVHLYWVLTEGVTIPDATLAPVFKKKTVTGKTVTFYDADGTPAAGLPKVSDRADYVQRVVAGVSAKIGGDHTQDLARVLRLPNTTNFKNARNGAAPKACHLHSLDPALKYPFAVFEAFALPATASGTTSAPTAVASAAPTPGSAAGNLSELTAGIRACETATDRSRADWALVLKAVSNGTDPDAVWEAVRGTGKFEEKGEPYFRRTWDKAVAAVRAEDEQYAEFDRAVLKVGPSAAPDTDVPLAADPLQEPSGKDKFDRMAEAVVKAASLRGEHPLYTGGRMYFYTGSRYAECQELAMKVRDHFKVNGWTQSNNVIGNVVPIVHSTAWRDAGKYGPMPFWTGAGGSPFSHPNNVIAYTNGLLDLSGTGPLIPHSPDWCSTVCLPYAHDPAATCPAWERFLDCVFEGDGDRAALLQEFFGYCLTCDTSLQKALVFVGLPRSGKGTTQRTLGHLVGRDNATGFALEKLATEFGPSALVNRSVALVGEVELAGNPHRSKIVEVWKSIIGEDEISVNTKHDPVMKSCRLPTRFVVAANQVPRLMDSSGALAARLLFVPFEVSFQGREDRDLENRLVAELPGIANWALAGLRRLRASGGRFTVGGGHRKLFEEYTASTSPVLAWIQDAMRVWDQINPGTLSPRCVTPEKVVISKADAYSAFNRWCQDHDIEPASQPWFGKDVKSILPKLKETKINMVTGERANGYLGLGHKVTPQPLYEGA